MCTLRPREVSNARWQEVTGQTQRVSPLSRWRRAARCALREEQEEEEAAQAAPGDCRGVTSPATLSGDGTREDRSCLVCPVF
ncbi:unnamed protein product [Lampetra fluviatilis]